MAIDQSPSELRGLPAEPGRRLWSRIMEPKGRIAFELAAGNTLRIVDIDGQQVADFICFNKHDLTEKNSHSTTVMLKGNINVTTGDFIYSNEAWKMLKITQDTVQKHDLIAGTCCQGLNRFRYGAEAEHQPNCRSSLAAVMEPYGVKLSEIPYTFNIFMNVPVGADGSIAVVAPASAAGDFIDLEAQMDLIVAISNCPQERNICNGFKATRLGLVTYAGAAA